MNTERLIREIERRLADLPWRAREEALDAIREEIGRERRRSEPAPTIEGERSRRMEAETLREVLEAINRQARLVETIHEVLKQLARIVVFDSCSLSLLGPDGRFRILAVRGLDEPSRYEGLIFKSPLTDEVRTTQGVLSLADVRDDGRFGAVGGIEMVRSWAGIPLLVEGEVIGLLTLDRHRIEPFDDEDLHRAKAVAFSAAAAIRKARLLEQVRRYAALMERTVAVDHAVFTGRSLDEIVSIVLEGAAQLGSYPGGLLALGEGPACRVVATVGDAFAHAEVVGRTPPLLLLGSEERRLSAEATLAIGRELGLELPAVGLFVVPLATPEHQLGTLAFLDPDGDSADDRLMHAYASRAATAYLYASQRGH
ncbi:MAG: GAF domain-containing protein [Vicinamibacteria bacterium]